MSAVSSGLAKRAPATVVESPELVQLASKEQVRNEPLDPWLGRSPVDVTTLLSNTTEHLPVRRFKTIVHGQYGSVEEADVSAVYVAGGDQPCFGLSAALAAHLADLWHGWR